MPLKLCTLFGTRPEIIRLSRVLALADDCFEHITIHSGQNYDKNLSDVFFKEMDIRQPNYNLAMAEKSSGLGDSLGKMFSGLEDILKKEKPDAFLILGDTNTALGAYIAKRLHIPIFHMEAGNRSYDQNVPEETNRALADHISDYNLTYTEHARRHLIAEGLAQHSIFVTGSPMLEVLKHYENGIEKSNAIEHLKLQKKKFILASIHREENIDVEEHLNGIFDGLELMSKETGFPVLVSAHPRTAKAIERRKENRNFKNVSLLPPFSFFEYCKLQKEAYCVVSDSGTISEESAILNFPAITPRYAIERPESLDVGTIIKCAPKPLSMLQSMETSTKLFARREKEKIAHDYLISNTSARVISIIQSHTSTHATVRGLHKNKIVK